MFRRLFLDSWQKSLCLNSMTFVAAILSCETRELKKLLLSRNTRDVRPSHEGLMSPHDPYAP